MVNSLKHFRYGKHHFIIQHEFADLNSCCIFILVSDQPCIALQHLIVCQVSIMIELLVKKFLNFASVFQGEAQEVVQYGLVL